MSGILAALATALLLPTGAAAASMFKVLHEFTGKDGPNPDAGLIFDAAGNLYGTTSAGGAFGKGTVFKLTPNSNGSWTESVLHSFCVPTNCADGFNPVAGLIFDGAGNLYGTTPLGPGGGSGVIFKLKPNADAAPGRRLCCTALLGPPTDSSLLQVSSSTQREISTARPPLWGLLLFQRRLRRRLQANTELGWELDRERAV